ncbi:MAG: methionine synthase, partial [Candidatus Rokubacteria bacterium]|nr:methionine synthase [Candidatus Rokubacteria bacterium]
MSTLPLLPTTVVGSHGKPGWWYAGVKAYEAGEFGPADLEEMFDDAADTAIRDMEWAGIDIITDGEVRRLDGYVDSYYAIIKGIQPIPARRKAGPWGYDQQTRYEAVGRIETPPGGLGIIKEFEYLQSHTAKRTKATCAGPLTFGTRIHPGPVYKGVVDGAERFAEVINAELKGLVAAGADLIQIDEPARGNVSGEEMARLFNLATDGVKAKLAYHICFGNRFGRSRFNRSYRP